MVFYYKFSRDKITFVEASGPVSAFNMFKKNFPKETIDKNKIRVFIGEFLIVLMIDSKADTTGDMGANLEKFIADNMG